MFRLLLEDAEGQEASIMTAFDRAWDMSKQADSVKQMVDSYLHGLEQLLDSLDEMVMSDYLDMGNRPMLEDEDNHTMGDTASLKAMMEAAKAEVMRRLR